MLSIDEKRNQASLPQALEAKRWFRESEYPYPPNRLSPSVKGSEYVPLSMIKDMYEKNKSILEMELQGKMLLLIKNNYPFGLKICKVW